MKELKRMMLDHYNVEIPERTKMLMLNMDTTLPKPFAVSADRGALFFSAFRSNTSLDLIAYEHEILWI